MKAYIVVEVDVKDPTTYESYKDAAPASIAKYGGKYLVRGAKCTTLEGSWDPKRFVILEFPSGDAARAWHASAEYAPAKAIRHRTASSDMILVEGPPFDPAQK